MIWVSPDHPFLFWVYHTPSSLGIPMAGWTPPPNGAPLCHCGLQIETPRHMPAILERQEALDATGSIRHRWLFLQDMVWMWV